MRLCIQEYTACLKDPLMAPAAFIVESVMCCGGQIILPEGYLKSMTDLTRAAGGITIADEVRLNVKMMIFL